MSDVLNEISTDYDIDQDPADDLDPQITEIEALDAELNQLMKATIAIESFGMNPTAMGVLKATNLLSGTSLDALAMENFRFEGPGEPETEMALENLTDKIKEKALAWSAKIVTFAKDMTTKSVAMLDSLWSKISTLGTTLANRSWEGAKATGRTIKAHPFKTIAVVLTAAMAVAAVIAFAASGAPGAAAGPTALKSFMSRVQDLVMKIKWPYGKLSVKVAEDGSKIACNIAKVEGPVKETATATALNWTASSVKAVTGQASRAFNAVKSGVTSAVPKVVSVFKKLDTVPETAIAKTGEKVTAATGSNVVGWAGKKLMERMYNTALWSVLGMLYLLLKDVALKALRMVAETFTSLQPLVDKVEAKAA